MKSLLLTLVRIKEDTIITDASDDVESPRELYCPFELPQEEFGEMMFERRLARDGSSSPPASPRPASRRGSTARETDGIFMLAV